MLAQISRSFCPTALQTSSAAAKSSWLCAASNPAATIGSRWPVLNNNESQYVSYRHKQGRLVYQSDLTQSGVKG